MAGIIQCPVCTRRYRVRRDIPDSGARMVCPSCTHEFSFGRRDLSGEHSGDYESTVTDSAIMDMETSLSMTGLQLVDEGMLQLPEGAGETEVVAADDPRPEVTASTRRSTPAPRPRQAEPPPVATPTPTSASSIRPEVIATPASARARKLLDEPTYVTQERYIQVADASAPVRWGLIGAGAALLLVTCAGLGGVIAVSGSTPPASAAAPVPVPVEPAQIPVPVPLPAMPPPAPKEVDVADADLPEPVEDEPAPTAKPASRPSAASAPRPRPRPSPRAEPAPAPRAKPAPAPVPTTDPAPSADDELGGSDLIDPWG